MTVAPEALRHRRLRAPREDGELLIVPASDQIGDLLSTNLNQRLTAHQLEDGFASYDCQGRSLADLAQQARREVLQAATTYTSAYRDVDISADAMHGPLIMTGHQPELFHPGVWCKNFAGARLADAHGGVALNLLVDSDVVRQAAVRVPSGSVDNPIVESIPLDRARAPIPYEEFEIADERMFADFGQRAREALRPLVSQPLLDRFWPLAIERSQEVNHLGACLAQARHQLEGQWGLQTLEVPQSVICRQESCCWLFAHILAHLPRFVEVHNSALSEYRQLNRIRSRSHPVPMLESEGDWLEAPFWIWTADEPRRRRLFVRQRGDELIVSDRANWERALHLTSDGDAARAAEQLAGWMRTGTKIRTRALITTLMARLLLSDLFIHGIGGAKYDQLTDALIERFFGLQPPCFVTISGTLRLPIARPNVSVDELQSARRTLRDLQWHGEKYLSQRDDADEEVRRCVEDKRRWIATPQTIDNARERFLALRASNAALRMRMTAEIEQQHAHLERTRNQLRHESILASRDYSFCLYPKRNLCDLLLDKVAREI